MTQDNTLYDVMVIGSGFAGMAAALFAAKRGLKVVQAGSTGGIDFSTGFIDLMGVHPISEGKRWMNPWKAIDAVVADHPKHPYGLMTSDEISASIDGFTDFLAEQGLEYVGNDDRNTCTLTSAGTVKRTYRLPKSAWKGAEAFESKAPTLIVDFNGLKGFSGNQLVENRKERWPELRTVRVDFPNGKGELYPEHMAWALADPANRVKLAETVMEHAGDAEYIGFPAVLGLIDPQKIVDHLEELTGKHIFEIPTMPPSIAGPRLRAVFDRGLPALGVQTLSQKMITGATMDGGVIHFTVGKGKAANTVSAKSCILATGRFFGKGLKAQRDKIIEPVFGVPVCQPEARDEWHGEAFFDKGGHPVNLAGVEVDSHLRPLGVDGSPMHDNLYAAGAVLAHHDWMRMKCGAGLAIATAYKAVVELAK
ncbi:glycerol-3-phosphate dehydrogenase subunit GlpB [Pseudodesulfovibrio sp. zrk46]|uniref:glycerol-3-phosphate dehydrogenase subunit GlpB n=1 Tax=Pseudodesulfovibrio sp. zrk46 TaxID=2725288 RepID=UPI001449589F|nr:glycerol-3-phosphate dehydrogenase subunit GlpB [Pseudodesulfovibrio sp. zrk46]QJB57131.1 glycerol-3-phosphate dehydrogenase subunit GlpB [Pseudodesulfovibrio sp. zrk46]